MLNIDPTQGEYVAASVIYRGKLPKYYNNEGENN